MKKISNETKIGTLVLITIVLLIWGLNFLKGRNIFVSGNVCYGIYSSVEGLNESSPLYYQGLKVGNVNKIAFYPEKPGFLLVSFNIASDVFLARNSIAQIYSVDLMGTKAIRIIGGDSTDKLNAGDTLRTAIVGDLKDQVSMEVLPLKDKTERLIVRMDTILGRMFDANNTTLFKNSSQDLHSMIANFNDISLALKLQLENDGNIYRILSYSDSVIQVIANNKSNIDSVLNRLNVISKQIEDINITEVANRFNGTLMKTENIIDSINNGVGTLGLLLTDKSLFNNANQTILNTNRLMMDVRHNPKKYVNFSLFDIGRKVYPDPKNIEEGIVFKLGVEESSEPIEFSKEQKKQFNIEEYFNGKKYLYTIESSKSFNAIKVKRDELLSIFANAEVVAFNNGVQIPVSKAIRKIK